MNSNDLEAYIRSAAAQRGIDPDQAMRVARSEGFNSYTGDNGSSFGPFQLHYGNVAPGGNSVSGLGDVFTARTGLDARDPRTVPQQVDFALDHAARNGWGPWHGWRGDPWTGIGNQASSSSPPLPAVASAPTSSASPAPQQAEASGSDLASTMAQLLPDQEDRPQTTPPPQLVNPMVARLRQAMMRQNAPQLGLPDNARFPQPVAQNLINIIGGNQQG